MSYHLPTILRRVSDFGDGHAGSIAVLKIFDDLDRGTLAKAVGLARQCGLIEPYAVIQARPMSLLPMPGLLLWDVAVAIMTSILEKAEGNDAPISRHVSQAANLQPELSSDHPPPIIVTSIPSSLDQAKQVVSLLSGIKALLTYSRMIIYISCTGCGTSS